LASALRERKDAVEVAAIRRALTIAQTAFGAVVETLRPGISEREVAIELEYQMKHRGAMAAAFPIIVASGPRGSLPHGRPTDRRLRPAEPIVIDWGAVADFYCCDLTRTVFLGNIPRYWRGKYDLVLRAQARGIAALAGHGKASRADRMARGFLKRHRLGKRFGHGLGHGVGMATHEAPSLSQLSKTELQPGMVVTVEPGIYIPGRGGIRIEDMVLVRGGGAEVLSFLAKDVESAVI
jgi:Xaa-Pro aminopeptidase/Xaa-Pro dipeptidase